MLSKFEKTMPIDAGRDERPRQSGFRLNHALRACVDWLARTPQRQPASVARRLFIHSLALKRTLFLAVLATSAIICIAVALSGKPWAYGWLLVDLLMGGLRLGALAAFERAEASGREGDAATPIVLGLIWAVNFSAGCTLCVISGEWPLILLAGILIAGGTGAFTSRNAGTPRYGIAVMAIQTIPYALAMLFSPIPYMFIVFIGYSIGTVSVMMENHRILCTLFLSERENIRLANHDPLTDLPNRNQYQARFEQLLAEGNSASEAKQPTLTVFCLDLDGFKGVNDKFGHPTGDAVLVAVASRLLESVRPTDLVCRIGGDEFVILLPNITPSDADKTARRIIARISEPLEIGRETICIGMSIGSSCSPCDGKTASELLRGADSALYRAKQQSRGTYVMHGTMISDSAGIVPDAEADARMAGTSQQG